MQHSWPWNTTSCATLLSLPHEGEPWFQFWNISMYSILVISLHVKNFEPYKCISLKLTSQSAKSELLLWFILLLKELIFKEWITIDIRTSAIFPSCRGFFCIRYWLAACCWQCCCRWYCVDTISLCDLCFKRILYTNEKCMNRLALPVIRELQYTSSGILFSRELQWTRLTLLLQLG